jgi:hypothetical protein
MVRTNNNSKNKGVIRKMAMAMTVVLTAMLLAGNVTSAEAFAKESEAVVILGAGTLPTPPELSMEGTEPAATDAVADTVAATSAYTPNYSDNPIIAEVEKNLEAANPSFTIEGAAAWHDEIWDMLARNNLSTYREHNTGNITTRTRGTDITFTIEFYCTAEEQTLLDAYIDMTIPMLTGQSTYDTVRNVHDYVCGLADYCYEDDGTMMRYDPYSIIAYGTGVCNAYALLFQRYMERMDIPCYIARGTAKGGPHAWNIVMVDGQWYHVDCTWDGQDPVTRHTYFLLGTDRVGYTTWGYDGMTQVTLAATSYGHR